MTLSQTLCHTSTSANSNVLAAKVKEPLTNKSALPNRIVCAAIRKCDIIICGARHFDPVMTSVLELLGDKSHDWEQGFIDKFGKFHDRKSAWVIAEQSNQIIRQVSTPGTLYSENLY